MAVVSVFLWCRGAVLEERLMEQEEEDVTSGGGMEEKSDQKTKSAGAHGGPYSSCYREGHRPV